MTEENKTHSYKKQYRRARKKRHGIFFPLLMVTIGIYLLYNNIGNPDGSTLEALLRLWPVLLIVGGLDGIITNDGAVISVLSMGIGVYFLLYNFGYIQTNDIWSYLRFWPVFLIALGLDLIVGRNSIWATLAGIFLGCILLAGIGWMVINPAYKTINMPAVTHEYQQELDGIEQATIHISRISGFVEISGKSEPSMLVQSKITTGKNEVVQQRGTENEGKGSYVLSDNDNTFPAILNYHPSKNWLIHLNSTIPLVIDTRLIVGEMNLDLSKLELDNFSSELILGRTVINLPDGDYHGSIDTPVGEIVIYVPQDADVRIRADTALTTVFIPDEYVKSDEIISSDPSLQNVGDVDIDLSVDIPVGSLMIKTY